MTRYAQASRAMKIETPIGRDALLLIGLEATEGISELFRFTFDTLAENRTAVDFAKFIGQEVTAGLSLPGGKFRYFSGICSGMTQGGRDAHFSEYRFTVVPRLWLKTRIAQSRIFQHVAIPDILKKVLEGLDLRFEIQGTFHKRNYCVQYRETDFDFASRLMEEEGLFYFFRHTEKGHQLVVANTPQSHQSVPGGKIIFETVEGGTREEERIFTWIKTQDLRSGRVQLWDHCFELPGRNLAADQATVESVAVGKTTHKLKVGGNEKLELYDYPGAYAQRFDGVNKSGGDQASELQQIFEENKRTVKIRMQQEELPSLLIQGSSNCTNLSSGSKFTLERHHDADGDYVLTRVEHRVAMEGNFRSGGEVDLTYENRFSCIPAALPYRPLRTTPKPVVQGSQTAVVVGPPGEEIFTDKYGRVKVQFHWDREGKFDSDSSCWVRVGTPLAGRKWGMIHIPRIGQEVIVDFLEGDPDRPIVVGSVYNADQMPAYGLPEHKTKLGIKSYSSPGGGGFNEIRFEDKKGKEQIFIHGEMDLDIRVKNDRREWIGRDRHLIVRRDRYKTIERDEHSTVQRDRLEKLERDHHLEIAGKQAVHILGSQSLKVDGAVMEQFAADHSAQVAGELFLKANKVVIEAASGLTLKVGGNFLTIDPGGVFVSGTMVMINSGGSALTGSAGSLVPPSAPGETKIADNADPGDKAPTYRNQTPVSTAPSHQPEKNKDKESWIEIELVDEEGNPVPGERYEVTLPDGSTVASGTLDEKGFARIDNIDSGTCKVSFPGLDKDAWEPK